MSVLECHRNQCENIMCDRYSREYGYICEECFEELCAKGTITDIKQFMQSAKPKYSHNEAVKSYMSTIFPVDR